MGREIEQKNMFSSIKRKEKREKRKRERKKEKKKEVMNLHAKQPMLL